MVEIETGLAVGADESDGLADGNSDGVLLGRREKISDGAADGLLKGIVDGESNGLFVGSIVLVTTVGDSEYEGSNVGSVAVVGFSVEVGALVGDLEAAMGDLVGEMEGEADGAGVLISIRASSPNGGSVPYLSGSCVGDSV